jgi:hypothetical protein
MSRFTIRDLLWLTVVVGLGVGWWIDRHALAESRNTWKGSAIILRVYAEHGPKTFTLRDDGGLDINDD